MFQDSVMETLLLKRVKLCFTVCFLVLSMLLLFCLVCITELLFIVFNVIVYERMPMLNYYIIF